MVAVTIRQLTPETHEALKLRAKSNGRSTEAEIREILRNAVALNPSKGLGTELFELGQRYGGIVLDIPPRSGLARAHDFGDDNS